MTPLNLRAFRNASLVALVLVSSTQGIWRHAVEAHRQATVLDLWMTFIFCVGATTCIALWCWFDSKISAVELPMSAYCVMALCGFWTVSRYFYLRDGPRRWFVTLMGFWLFG